jgi:hypothetical protein
VTAMLALDALTMAERLKIIARAHVENKK